MNKALNALTEPQVPASTALENRYSFPEELKLVDKTLCGYLKSYEISANRYKDTSILFQTKKPSIIRKIIDNLVDLKGLKFQLGLTVRLIKDRKETTGHIYSFQEALTNSDNISYDQSTAHIENSIEKFTNNGSG